MTFLFSNFTFCSISVLRCLFEMYIDDQLVGRCSSEFERTSMYLDPIRSWIVNLNDHGNERAIKPESQSLMVQHITIE